MSQFITLVKNNLRTSFNFNALSKNAKKRNTKKKNSLILPIFIIVLFLFLSFLYSGMIAALSYMANMQYTTIYFGAGIGAILCLFFTFAQSYSTLFKSKDFEFLMSLPIPTKVLVASKFVSLSVIGYGAFALFYVPAVIMTNFVFGINLLLILFSLITLILAPMLIITICSLISYVIARLLAKFKYQKVVKIIAALLFFIVYFFAIFSFSTLSSSIEGEDVEYAVQFCTQITNIFSKIYYPSNWIINALNGEYLYLLLYIATSVIPFGLFIYFVGKNFLKANMSSKVHYKNKNFVLKEQGAASVNKALFKKEFKTLFSSTTYLLNSIIGPVLSIVTTVVISSTIKNLTGEEGFTEMSSILPFIIIFSSSFIIGMVPTTSCSINFEGKRLWILKSAPISTKQIIMSKLYVYFAVSAPFVLINGIVTNVLVDMDILSRILVFVIPAFLAGIYGVDGMLINTISYRLDWNTEAEAIKQGTNTLWSMLATFGILILFLIPTIVISIVINSTVGLIFATLMSIGLFALMYALTIKHGTKNLDKITC